MSRYLKVWFYAAALIVVGCKSSPQQLPSTTDAAADAVSSADASTSDASVSSARTCSPGVGPKSPSAACDRKFTSDGHACAVCLVTSGCLSVATQVYCVKSCADSACKKK